jgi:hypothetical protein
MSEVESTNNTNDTNAPKLRLGLFLLAFRLSPVASRLADSPPALLRPARPA